MEPAVQTVVKFSGIEDILGALPYRIGFVPTECLVLMCLRGPRRRDELVVRVDLAPSEHDEAVTAPLLAAVARVQASAAVVVCYTESADEREDLPRRQLVDRLVQRLQEREVDVVDAVLVRDGRRWSYHCDDEACCPSAGTPLPVELTAAAGRYVAEVVHQGRAPLPDRAALAASIRPPGNVIGQTARTQAYDRAADVALGLVAEAGPAGLRERTLALLGQVLHRWVERTHEVTPDEAALLALGFRDRRTRDEGLTLALDDLEVFVGLFVELARHTDDPVAAPVCTMLAWAAYAQGEGALAAVAVERALDCEPNYYMAQLIRTALANLMRPEPIREVIEHVRDDLRAEQLPRSAPAKRKASGRRRKRAR